MVCKWDDNCGNMVVAVGLAMVINLMASKETWPFFFIGFAIAPLNELTLIATGGYRIKLSIYLFKLIKQQ